MILDEVIRRGEQVHGIDVGFAELILTGGLVLVVGKKATSAWGIYPTPIKIWPFYYILSKKLQISNQTRIENTPRMEETPGGLPDAKC
jgi:hypothetical protein